MNGERVIFAVVALGCFVGATQLRPAAEQDPHGPRVLRVEASARPAATPGARPSAPAAAQTVSNPHGDIGFSCAECHTTESWTPLRDPLPFDHRDTGYALLGNHLGPDCADCHGTLQFAAVATACADCHTDVHRGEMGFGCSSCHSETGWLDRRQMYVFHFTTGFPLLGGHASVDCESCHRPEPPYEFASTPTDCVACHAEDYRQTVDPDHVASGFGTDCESCHTIDSWRGALLPDHEFFPLEGGHAFVPCASCHAQGFAGTSTDCYACHSADYRDTREPDHELAGFSTDCQDCHTIRDWDADFDHEAFFRLQGAHRALDCQACHVDRYAGTPTDCYACHADEYDATTDPDHAAAGFPTDCDACHHQRSWEGADFDHDSVFELVGAHRRVDCEACHVDGYSGTPRDCYSCHVADYEGTTDPDHVDAGFPTDCQDCHDQRDWSNAVFDHDAFFRLQGAHRSLACESCHTDGYAGTPTDCYGCHASDYRDTDDPDHQAAGFPTDCEACHDQGSWEGAVFDHDAVFRLEGAHRTLECDSCHADGYAGTPTDCFGCHASDYRNTDDPDHQAAGFPTDCDLCHDQRSWDDATFDHASFFPIYTGTHAGEWDNCADCHVQPGNFQAFECILCHEHGQADMADEHDDVSGYQWVSTACYSCHPQGRADDD